MNSNRLTLLPSSATIMVVVLGPLLSVLMAVNVLGPKLGTGELPLALLAVLLFWSPLFFSIPSFLMQDGRDRVLPQMRGIASVQRAFLLIPATLKKSSGIQRESIAALVGFVIALAVAAPFMSGVASSLM